MELHRSPAVFLRTGVLQYSVWEEPVKFALGVAMMLLIGMQLQAAAAPVTFPQVTADPVPLHSASGRFSSIDPPNQLDCSNREVSGRVVSPRLIMVRQI